MKQIAPLADQVSEKRRVCVVTSYPPSLTETFIRSHIERLPAEVTLAYGWRPTVGNEPVLPLSKVAYFKMLRMLTGGDLVQEQTAAYLTLFRNRKIQAILAEYGESGVQVMEAARQASLPLIVHFHGYDASVTSVLQEHRQTYPQMFSIASAIIAVSRSMERKLIELGAPPQKVHYNPYGIDCTKFGGARPALAPPIFLAVGRFTEKKAPATTLSAFARVLKSNPAAKLRMVGEGPLLEQCKQLTIDLGISKSVTFLGGQNHEFVQREMQNARCFVQHSIVAPSGDCEGTPVSILEAGGTGLPVVSTRHAGIPDVVVEGQTGFLVDEHDEVGMAEFMTDLSRDAELADRLGTAARQHILAGFSCEQRLGNLWNIIEESIAKASSSSEQISWVGNR